MSWFRNKSAPKTPEPQSNSYNPPAEDYIPDEYDRNRRELFAPSGGQGRGPSPQAGYRPPQRNKYDTPDDDEAAYRSNVLRKAGPPPSAEAIAREANSVRAMPERYNRSGGPNDAYSRGVRDLNQDRANLFAGATVQPRAGGANRYDERSGGGAGGDEEEEDLEAIQTKTKDIKQQSVQSTREALRMMREAEETGKNTLLKLGQQSEQLGMTERHLQTSKGYIRRADDNTSDIKALNRSIFIPVITFDKSKKRAEQDAKMARRYEEEKAERDATNARMMETHNRIASATSRNNRDGPPDDDDEQIGGGRFNAQQMAARKAQWAKYQSRDDDEEDDAMENEISNNLDELSLGIGRIKALAHAQGDIVKRQNDQLKQLHNTVDDVDRKLVNSTDRMRRI
ncbi:hypothetical protein CPB86DRAFT_747041 [Serendipita vermifera]|nr:hypothetical protein CPB86DRAFT_747041 [Serendipita vermifera]